MFHMIVKYCLFALIAAGTSLLTAIRPTEAVEVDTKHLENCQRIESRLNRLNCFDRLLNTPPTITRSATGAPDKSEPASKVAENGSIRVLISDLEKSRETEAASRWLVRKRKPGRLAFEPVEENVEEKSGPKISENLEDMYDVYMLIREFSPVVDPGHHKKPTLLLTCEGNITSLYFVNNTEFSSTRVPVTFRTGQGAKISTKMQTDRDNTVLLAGRGLESIDLIKRLLGHNRIVVGIGDESSEKLSAFHIEGLSSYLRPLRQSCHW